MKILLNGSKNSTSSRIKQTKGKFKIQDKDVGMQAFNFKSSMLEIGVVYQI